MILSIEMLGVRPLTSLRVSIMWVFWTSSGECLEYEEHIDLKDQFRDPCLIVFTSKLSCLALSSRCLRLQAVLRMVYSRMYSFLRYKVRRRWRAPQWSYMYQLWGVLWEEKSFTLANLSSFMSIYTPLHSSFIEALLHLLNYLL